MREALIDKLRPDRYTAMSGKMAAIVGYILEERFSDPAITELVVASDGFALAQREGEVGANEMIGEETDLNRNLLLLCRYCPRPAKSGSHFDPPWATPQGTQRRLTAAYQRLRGRLLLAYRASQGPPATYAARAGSGRRA